MSAIEAATDRYRTELPYLQAAELAVAGILRDVCQGGGLLAQVHTRVKDLSSFVKKAMTKPGYDVDPWARTTDKVGARVIVLTLTDRAKAWEELRRSPLSILSEEDKQALAGPDQLFYPGVHLQVVVPEATTSDGEPIECEIQLRTQAEDLWSVPSHKLLYKGPVAPGTETQRRVWRLSALVELFDEEVERAMADMMTSPDYAEAHILALAEAAYYTFVPEPGVRELSIDVLRELTAALPSGDAQAAYEDQLRQFAEQHRGKLRQIYVDFGARSDFAANAKYWLFTQPESVFLFERIANRPMLLREAARGSEIEYAIEPLFSAWGVSYETT